MKKLLFSLMMCLAFAWNSNAQTNVQLNILHKLADANFAMSTVAENNMGDNFEVSRLQYYISEIALIHDGGAETYVPQTWILVDASQATAVDLGDYDITNLESIRLHIGVGVNQNHQDPALYPTDHPLAPQWPSMHWGWASGYRFLAIEGNGGDNLSQPFQLHSLGDDNYFETTIEYVDIPFDGVIDINLNADYTRVLEDISLASGMIVHGDYGEAKQALENFRDYVFSGSPDVIGIEKFAEINSFEVYPNPSASNENIAVKIDATTNDQYEVKVMDLMGRVVSHLEGIQSNTITKLQIEQAGMYMVRLLKDGQTITTQQLMVN
ncbi:MAG: MbnP family protein [Chitinophagales bacterium]